MPQGFNISASIVYGNGEVRNLRADQISGLSSGKYWNPPSEDPPVVRDHFSIPDVVDLYLGDALEILPTLDVEVDLLIADPPYPGQTGASNRRKNRFADLLPIDVPDLLRASLRVMTRHHKHAYIFECREAIDDVPELTSVEELVWDKCRMSGGNLRSPWGKSHEKIHFATNCPCKYDRDRGDGRLTARMRRGSILRYPRPTGDSHPTEKPVELIQDLIESSSHRGDLVLDPCCGTGSTLVAAYVEGRRAVGIELEREYFEVAKERLLTLWEDYPVDASRF